MRSVGAEANPDGAGVAEAVLLGALARVDGMATIDDFLQRDDDA